MLSPTQVIVKFEMANYITLQTRSFSIRISQPRRYSSGQRGLAVNQLASASVGSNPTKSTCFLLNYFSGRFLFIKILLPFNSWRVLEVLMSESVREEVIDDGEVRAKYAVGERVIFTALFNSPGHMKPDDGVPGIVITVFRNGELPEYVYRLELDMVWNERVPILCGKKIIVGNIRERQISPLTNPV